MREHLADKWDKYGTPTLIQQEIIRKTRQLNDLKRKPKPLNQIGEDQNPQQEPSYSAEEWESWYAAGMPEDDPEARGEGAGGAEVSGTFRGGGQKGRKGKGKGKGKEAAGKGGSGNDPQ